MGIQRDNRLNREIALERMSARGLSQADVGRQLNVTRQTVSQWLHGERFPRPDKLLRLGRLLELTRDQLVHADDDKSPVCMYRRKAGHRIPQGYLAETQHRARLLELLVPHLPYDCMSRPPTLIDPRLDHDYVEKAAERVRDLMGKGTEDPVEIADLVGHYRQHHAVLVPVFWGDTGHEHGLHVYLPSSMTTWVYVNLMSSFHDFKFWLAHELGHVKAPGLREAEGEGFADAFAGALLLPGAAVARLDNRLRRLTRTASQVACLHESARRLAISPLTIYYRLAVHARACGHEPLRLDQDQLIFRATSAFRQKDRLAAQDYFTSLPPGAEEYVATTTTALATPFFRAVRAHLRQTGQGTGFLQSVLQLSAGDAQALYEVLG